MGLVLLEGAARLFDRLDDRRQVLRVRRVLEQGQPDDPVAVGPGQKWPDRGRCVDP